MPASSAMSEIATISSHSARHRSGAVLTAKPPSQFALNSPNLNRFEPRIGLASVFKASSPTQHIKVFQDIYNHIRKGQA